jgi:hypothetical protein
LKLPGAPKILGTVENLRTTVSRKARTVVKSRAAEAGSRAVVACAEGEPLDLLLNLRRVTVSQLIEEACGKIGREVTDRLR